MLTKEDAVKYQGKQSKDGVKAFNRSRRRVREDSKTLFSANGKVEVGKIQSYSIGAVQERDSIDDLLTAEFLCLYEDAQEKDEIPVFLGRLRTLMILYLKSLLLFFY